jgi:kynurenine formamidase
MTQEEIISGKTTKLGIQAWAKQGIVGRGVLVDFVSYAKRNSINYNPTGFFAVSLSTFKEIAKESNFTFHAGDIIFLRTGFTLAFETAARTEQEMIMSKTPFQYPGMESSVEVLEWLWDTGIAAVAGDCPGFEAWPPKEPFKGMHQTLLAGFGMPIGEMFDLEGLALQCEKEKRWTFFMTSEVLNVKGGVASPPNALAIF